MLPQEHTSWWRKSFAGRALILSLLGRHTICHEWESFADWANKIYSEGVEWSTISVHPYVDIARAAYWIEYPHTCPDWHWLVIASQLWLLMVNDGLREHTFSSALTHWELGGASCMEGKHVDEYRQDNYGTKKAKVITRVNTYWNSCLRVWFWFISGLSIVCKFKIWFVYIAYQVLNRKQDKVWASIIYYVALKTDPYHYQLSAGCQIVIHVTNLACSWKWWLRELIVTHQLVTSNVHTVVVQIVPLHARSQTQAK